MAANEFGFEPAGELRFGQVGIANLRILRLDLERLAEDMAARVARAPAMFAGAAVVIDFGALSTCPDAAVARALIDRLRTAGVRPVALAYGTREIEALAASLDLPLLAKFRAQYESESSPPSPPERSRTRPQRSVEPATRADHGGGQGGSRVISQPVRSGQQVYAEGGDLVLTGQVGAGAEVIADGSIHVYGPLRGRALAGASGNTRARIFCLDFAAELVSVAGHYKVIEEIPAGLRGKPVQVWLDGASLRIEQLP